MSERVGSMAVNVYAFVFLITRLQQKEGRHVALPGDRHPKHRHRQIGAKLVKIVRATHSRTIIKPFYKSCLKRPGR